MPPASKARVFNISGPYAVGKDSVLNHLLKVYPDVIHRVRTVTTRPVSMDDDPSYTHADPAEFHRIVAEGDWLFNVQLSGSTAYATDLNEIRDAIGRGLVCVHSIYPGPEGAAALRRAFGSQLYSIALLPPGANLDDRLAVLRDRLLARNRDSAEALEQRLLHQADALEFIAANPTVQVGDAALAVFDEVLVNDDLDQTVAEATELFITNCLDRHHG
jgi:guanylate kinase